MRLLRAAQFPEDAGPLAHPVRPDSYMEIANFYTATVYNKGAELIRMLHTLLGPERFRAGTDLYFDRHDGAGGDLRGFRPGDGGSERRGSVAFPPLVRAGGDSAGQGRASSQDDGTARLRLEQEVPPTPGQPVKKPMPIPLRIALFGETSGDEARRAARPARQGARTKPLFDGIGETAVLSINRGFSAPVIVETERPAADLAFLSAHDDDPFARYEAMQQLMLDTLLARDRLGDRPDHGPVVDAVRER